ncbi:hypothetical protein C8R45DRAFT_933968 [Mycena sanguinolenta]|nr:hypothetical protein C8R45DRAFT_933968 [Mycena sanguinolenta]
MASTERTRRVGTRNLPLKISDADDGRDVLRKRTVLNAPLRGLYRSADEDTRLEDVLHRRNEGGCARRSRQIDKPNCKRASLVPRKLELEACQASNVWNPSEAPDANSSLTRVRDDSLATKIFYRQSWRQLWLPTSNGSGYCISKFWVPVTACDRLVIVKFSMATFETASSGTPTLPFARRDLLTIVKKYARAEQDVPPTEAQAHAGTKSGSTAT